VSFAAITFCDASQREFIVVVLIYFVMDSVRKLMDKPLYIHTSSGIRPHNTRAQPVQDYTSTPLGSAYVYVLFFPKNKMLCFTTTKYNWQNYSCMYSVNLLNSLMEIS